MLSRSTGSSRPDLDTKRVLLVAAVLGVAALVIVGGWVGGTYLVRISQQPNIQATSINIPEPTADRQTSSVLNEGRVSSSASFSHVAKVPGSYSLIFDNGFSTFSSKSVALSWTDPAGATHTQTFSVPPGDSYIITVEMKVNEIVTGSFAVSGGSGNDVNFYITARTCTQSITFSFTLVNSGSANGYATVQLQVDGQAMWTNRYFVPEAQQLPANGSITLPDCNSHSLNVIVTSQERA